MAGGINSTITKTASGHVDLINATWEKFDKGFFADTTKYTDNALVRLFFEEAVEDASGGNRLEWVVRLRASDTAQWIAPYGTSGNVQQTYTAKANAPWRALEEKLHYSLLEENMNRGPEAVVDMMTVKANAGMEAVHNLVEEALVDTLPTQTDENQIYGLGYWFSPCGTNNSGTYASATDATGGFNGLVFRSADGSSSTTIAGIDANDVANSRWRNWCGTHGGEMNMTLVQQIVRALTRTDFKTLPDVKDTSPRRTGRQVLLMGHTFADQYETIINSGPDWLRGDAAGQTEAKIRKVGIIRVPALDSLSTLDVYGINTRYIYGCTLAGAWMRKLPFINDRDSMHTYTAAMIGQAQLKCENRRRAGFRLHAVIS